MVHEGRLYTPTEDRVKEFHLKFRHSAPDKPCKPSSEDFYLRLKLVQEELEEVEKAYLNESLENYFKEMCDLQYVVDGLFVISGMTGHKETGIKIVHESNMSKLDSNGQPIFREDGKILKGPNYKPVDTEVLKDVLS